VFDVAVPVFHVRRAPGDLRAVLDAELPEDVREMAFDGPLGEEEGSGDSSVASSATRAATCPRRA
jgi:hypothetical protein